jgi:methylenetetrahydrofolate--tRNA-(uracil-5-)-methyltransferase
LLSPKDPATFEPGPGVLRHAIGFRARRSTVFGRVRLLPDLNPTFDAPLRSRPRSRAKHGPGRPRRSAALPVNAALPGCAAPIGFTAMSVQPVITVIGGGLAGCEAAWHAARYPVKVVLREMKPAAFSPAHQLPELAELVCSNSLRSNAPSSPAGQLKREMRTIGSLIIGAADECAVPAGQALAVDRLVFAKAVTERVESHPRIEVRREEAREIAKEGIVIIATGPLTSTALSERIGRLLGRRYLYFYDAVSPILYADTIDFTRCFRASRYGKGDDDYVNIPLDQEAYESFVRALCEAETIAPYEFEKAIYFEGCLPLEVLAGRGVQTLAHGPMKPVGLLDPRTGREPHAVVQLRQENKEGTLLSMVGFQTKLRYPEQERIFRMLPGLSNARFARLGSVHRNTFLNAPLFLDRTLQLRRDRRIFFAGQIVGVEGYVESAAMGIVAGLGAGRLAVGEPPVAPPPTTAMGALLEHVSRGNPQGFQPMNINFGLFAPPGGERSRGPKRSSGRLRKAQILERAARDFHAWAASHGFPEAR